MARLPAWAPICVQHWGYDEWGRLLGSVREGVAPSRNRSPGVLPPENFGNFICQTVHFGNICAIIGPQNAPILLCWILMLRSFWINFLLDSYKTLLGRKKLRTQKLAFIITENIHKLLVLWQNIRGDIHLRIVFPTKLLGDMPPCRPGFDAYDCQPLSSKLWRQEGGYRGWVEQPTTAGAHCDYWMQMSRCHDELISETQ